MFCNGSRLSIVARMEEEAVKAVHKSEIRNPKSETNSKVWNFKQCKREGFAVDSRAVVH
jgi:hypothetical protein